MAGRARPTWQLVSRVCGLAIVTVMFVLFCVSTVVHDVKIDKTLALPFLTIACGLIGIPSAYSFVVMRNGSNGHGSGKSGPP